MTKQCHDGDACQMHDKKNCEHACARRVQAPAVAVLNACSILVGAVGRHRDLTAEAALSKLQAENDKLRAGYAEAIDDIESWGAYASEYFQGKYDLAGTVAKHRAAIEAAGDAGEATCEK